MFFSRNAYHPARNYILLLLAVVFLGGSFSASAADKQTFKPFVLAKESKSDFKKAIEDVKNQIVKSPFSTIAEYVPYDNVHIFIISSDELKSLASKDKYGGFAAPQRISVTQVDNSIQIAYTNPVFMQHAYRMKNVDLQPILDQMTKAFGFEKFFGGEGMSARKLKRFKYSFGLEDFDSFYELPEYGSHKEAIAELEKGFEKAENGIGKVYKIKIPGKDQVIFGISMNSEASGDDALDVKKTMEIIDHLPLKRTPYLPYEIMVDNNKIIAMHARFRIAVNFYDLKMFGKHGFGKLFSTPTSYQKAFTKVSGGKMPSEQVENGFIN
jgi:uncharacterized protein (DUF302 family)